MMRKKRLHQPTRQRYAIIRDYTREFRKFLGYPHLTPEQAHIINTLEAQRFRHDSATLQLSGYLDSATIQLLISYLNFFHAHYCNNLDILLGGLEDTTSPAWYNLQRTTRRIHLMSYRIPDHLRGGSYSQVLLLNIYNSGRVRRVVNPALPAPGARARLYIYHTLYPDSTFLNSLDTSRAHLPRGIPIPVFILLGKRPPDETIPVIGEQYFVQVAPIAPMVLIPPIVPIHPRSG